MIYEKQNILTHNAKKYVNVFNVIQLFFLKRDTNG